MKRPPLRLAIALGGALAVVALVLMLVAELLWRLTKGVVPAIVVAPLALLALRPLVDKLALRRLGYDGPRIAWQSTWYLAFFLASMSYYDCIDACFSHDGHLPALGGVWFPSNVKAIGYVFLAGIVVVSALVAWAVRFGRAAAIVGPLVVCVGLALGLPAAKTSATAPSLGHYLASFTPVATFAPGKGPQPVFLSSGGFQTARYCGYEELCRFHLASESAPGHYDPSTDISEWRFPQPHATFVVRKDVTVRVSKDPSGELLVAEHDGAWREWIRASDLQEIFDAREILRRVALPWMMIVGAAAGAVLALVTLVRRSRHTTRLFGLDHVWRAGRLGRDGYVRFDDGTAPALAPAGTAPDDAPVMVVVDEGAASFRETGAGTITKLLASPDLRTLEDAARGADRAFAITAALLPPSVLVGAALLGLVR